MPGGWWCCCSPFCYLGEDNFDRADDDSLGTQWAELSGDFDIKDNMLHCVTAGICLTTLRQPVPTRTGNDYCIKQRFTLRDFPASGTKRWGVICGYKSATDYDWIQLDYDASTGELWPTFKNVNSVLMDSTTHPAGKSWGIYPETARFEMEVCYAEAEWTITHGGDEQGQGDVSWEMCRPGQTALPTTYGMVGFTQGDFDDWYYEIHWESNDDCEYCSCFCRNTTDVDDYVCVPETLALTVTPNTAYTCSPIDNMELEMYQSIPDVSGASPVYDKNPQKRWWYSETFTIETEKMWFVMECVDGEFRMACMAYPSTEVVGGQAAHLFFGTASTPSTVGKYATQSLSSCVPLELVFEDLHTGITTCNLDPGPGSGTRPSSCVSGVCWDTGEEIEVTWDVTVTE